MIQNPMIMRNGEGPFQGYREVSRDDLFELIQLLPGIPWQEWGYHDEIPKSIILVVSNVLPRPVPTSYGSEEKLMFCDEIFSLGVESNSMSQTYTDMFYPLYDHKNEDETYHAESVYVTLDNSNGGSQYGSYTLVFKRSDGTEIFHCYVSGYSGIINIEILDEHTVEYNVPVRDVLSAKLYARF